LFIESDFANGRLDFLSFGREGDFDLRIFIIAVELGDDIGALADAIGERFFNSFDGFILRESACATSETDFGSFSF